MKELIGVIIILAIFAFAIRKSKSKEHHCDDEGDW